MKNSINRLYEGSHSLCICAVNILSYFFISLNYDLVFFLGI